MKISLNPVIIRKIPQFRENENSVKISTKNSANSPTVCKLLQNKLDSAELEFGASQKCANIVGFEKMLQDEHTLTKVGFDTAENELRRVCCMIRARDLESFPT